MSDETPPGDPEVPPATPPAGEGQPPSDPPADPPSSDEPLGEGGVKALKAERELRKAADKAAKDAQAELEQLRAASMSDHEKALQEAAEAARREATAELSGELLDAALTAALTGKVVDPEVARRLLVSDELIGDNGRPDPTKITAAVSELLETAPYLAPAEPPTAPPSVPTGSRNGATAQLSRSDLATMSPEQISEARRDGRLAGLLAGN